MTQIRPRSVTWCLVAGIALSLVLASSAFALVSATYVADRSVLFLTPPTIDPPEDVNPFLSFTTSLSTAANVIALSVLDEATADGLAPEGSGSDYTITQEIASGGPVLIVTATARTSDESDRIADEVVELLGENLRELQSAAEAPKTTLISTSLIASSATPKEDSGQRVKAAVLAFMLGIAVMLGCLALIWWGGMRHGGRNRLGFGHIDFNSR